MSSPWLVAEQLRKSFRSEHRDLEVLNGVDLQVAEGEVCAITGPSGSGKSTLLNLLGSLDWPDGGRLLWGGTEVLSLSDGRRSRRRNRDLGFVFQSHHLLGDFTALENVLMPARVGGDTTGAARERAIDLLERVGVGDRQTHLPGELSGGEQQRVAVARALINSPRLLLADEPGGNLDRARADELHDLLLGLAQAEGLAMVIVTHDESLAGRAGRWHHLEGGLLTLRSTAKL